MRTMTMVLALGWGTTLAACGREPRTQSAADSARRADSIQLAALQADSAGGRAAARTPRAAGPAHEVIVSVTEQVPGLLASARFLPIDAQHLAQTKYPEGTVKGARIERRGGDLVYLYEIQRTGIEGSDVVLVNALDGTLIGTLHQDAAGQTVARRTP